MEEVIDDDTPVPHVPRCGEFFCPPKEFCDDLGLVKMGLSEPITFVFKDFICSPALMVLRRVSARG